MFWTEDNNKYIILVIYLFLSFVKSVVASIIIRETNIVNNTVFEQVLRKDPISGLIFAIKNQQIIVSNEFWTEVNNRFLIIVIYFPFIWRTCGSPNIFTRDTNIVNNTVFEAILRKNYIYGLTFSIKNR